MHTFIIASLTADGFIAQKPGQSSLQWTSKEDTQFFVRRTKQAGVMVVGSTTYATFSKPLPERLNVVYSRSPEKIANADHPLVKITQLEPTALLEELGGQGYGEVAICGGSSIYTQFMKAGVVDTLYLTVEPVLFGAGVPLFSEQLDYRIKVTDRRSLSDQTTLFEYTVIK